MMTEQKVFDGVVLAKYETCYTSMTTMEAVVSNISVDRFYVTSDVGTTLDLFRFPCAL